MTATDVLLDPTTQPPDAKATPMEDQTPEADAPPVADPAVPAPSVAAPEADQTPPAAGTDPALTGIDDRIAALEVRLTELTVELDAAGRQFESAGTRLDAVEASEVATAGRLAATDTRLDATDTRLAANDARLDAADQAVLAASEQIALNATRLTSLDGRLDVLDDHIATLQQHAADHDSALEDISRTIAVEVERHTSDALVQSQHSLQLAVNSIAQLALAMAESARDITEDVSPESATALLDSFRIDLDAILAQLGFESLDTSIGDVFDPHRHRALKRVPTADAAQDKTITRVIRDGYCSTATGRILLFADVEVSRHRAP